jgi:hypothetical protein
MTLFPMTPESRPHHLLQPPRNLVLFSPNNPATHAHVHCAHSLRAYWAPPPFLVVIPASLVSSRSGPIHVVAASFTVCDWPFQLVHQVPYRFATPRTNVANLPPHLRTIPPCSNAFKDVRIKKEDWPAKRAQLGHGLPLLEVDGKEFSESLALAR